MVAVRRTIGNYLRWGILSPAMLSVMACSQYDIPSQLETKPLKLDVAPTPAPRAEKSGEDDKKVPQVFEITEVAMWDGRPSIGDVWVAVPEAIQPERVQIKNEDTGLSIRGAMFVRHEPAKPDAPIKLSKGAAIALGITPNQPAMLTVTAIRNASSPGWEQPVRVTRRSDPLVKPDLNLAPYLNDDVILAGPSAPSVDPAPIDGGFIQVAEAISQDGADRVREQLALAAIPAEVQEDYVDGLSVYRVFASADTDARTLFGTLDSIRFANEAEGDSDGTMIAEMPNFNNLMEPEPQAEPWLEVGGYMSRNEAMAVVQRLSRRAVPSEVCLETRGGLMTVFRVFAGPSAQTEDGSTPDLKPIVMDNTSFCAGVAAADAARPVSPPAMVSAEPADMLPIIRDVTTDTSPVQAPVRIKVGEATGGLKLKVPNQFSDPIKIETAETTLTLPPDTPQEKVQAIVQALIDVEAALK